jgi:hypothetical protein
MAKFDKNDWTDFRTGATLTLPPTATVRFKEPAALMCGGVPVGYGTEIRLNAVQADQYKAGAAGAYYVAPTAAVEKNGESLTNLDKEQGPSALEASVNVQMRQLRLALKEAVQKKKANKKRMAEVTPENPEDLSKNDPVEEEVEEVPAEGTSV